MKKKYLKSSLAILSALFVSGIFLVSCLKDNGNVPVLGPTSITGVSSSSAVATGSVKAIGNSILVAYGVCWGTSENPTTDDSYVADSVHNNSGFIFKFSGLTANTKYYARVFATNTLGIGYGAQATFTTLAPAVPVVTTDTVSTVLSNMAICGGVISDDGGASISARGVCWSTSPNPAITDSKTSNGTGKGEFVSTMTGLSANTTYHFRAYATNVAGTSYGRDITFTTLQEP